MQNIVLVIHLLLTLALIGVVLLQRSEGGGLGIGGGAMGPQAGRPPLTGLAKLTWGFAIAFFVTTLTLMILSAADTGNSSVVERLGVAETGAADEPGAAIPLPDLPLPPSADQPLVPPRQDQ